MPPVTDQRRSRSQEHSRRPLTNPAWEYTLIVLLAQSLYVKGIHGPKTTCYVTCYFT